MTGVFLGREALADGLSRHDLQRWYRRIYRGVYIPKFVTPALSERTVGAWLTTDRTGIIGGVAASALHGAQWVDDDEPIEVFVNERRRQPGLAVRMDRIADDEVVTVDGLPVTTPSRTAFDLGRYNKRTMALARLDALMRAAPFAVEDVEMIMRRYGPVRGIRQLRDLLPLVDAGAESPKESWLRLLLIDGGLPAPETQIPICDGGVPVAFLDMGYRDIKLAVEYDGDQHRSDRRQYVRDIRRLAMVERRGWEVIRVIAEDRQAEVLLRVKEAFLRLGGAEIDEMPRSARTFAA
ncbi:type IV toxin-antitoxin system AbiEi family antitoxin [Mycolicibacterium sp. CBM1]